MTIAQLVSNKISILRYRKLNNSDKVIFLINVIYLINI